MSGYHERMSVRVFSLRVNMYAEGLMDLMEMMMMLPFTPTEDQKAKLDTIQTKAKERYLPVFEKVSQCSLFIYETVRPDDC